MAFEIFDYEFKLHKRGGHVVYYQVVRQSRGSFPVYRGYLADDGSWMIVRQSINGNDFEYKFVKGSSNFLSNWSNKENLTYVEYNEIFS